MGLLDKFSRAFLQEREGDFIKLEDSADDDDSNIRLVRPAVLLYNFPAGILDEELVDILEDGAPQASKKGVALQRIPDMNDPLLEMSLEEALQTVMNDNGKSPNNSSPTIASTMAPTVNNPGNPVLIFSGFSNKELMASYRTIAEEIFMENGGRAACAKAVPNALSKPLRQVVEEISGDHDNALKMEETPTEKQ
ncbi:MAG: hypothetical protein SGBAC_006170 [Bacillariaceae sp.]